MIDRKSFRSIGKKGIFTLLAIMILSYVLSGSLGIISRGYANPTPPPTDEQNQPGEQTDHQQQATKEKAEAEKLRKENAKLKAQNNKQQEKEQTFFAGIKSEFNALKKTVSNKNPFAGEKPSYEECDMFDLPCGGSMWLINWVAQGFVAVNNFIKTYLIQPDKLVRENENIATYYKYFQDLSWTFVLLFIVFHGIRLLIMYQITENHTQIKSILIKIFLVAIMISSMESIVALLGQLNKDIITGIVTSDNKFALDNQVGILLGEGGASFAAARATVLVSRVLPGGVLVIGNVTLTPFVIVVLALFLIPLFIVILQIILRNAELALLFLLGPLAIATMLNERYNYFHFWWKHLLTVIFTTSIQILLLSLTIRTFADSADFSKPLQGDFLFFIGFLILTLKTPSLLKEWIHTTDAASVVSGVASTAKKIVSAGRK